MGSVARYKWPSLAREYACLSLPNPPDLGGLSGVTDHHGVTPEELEKLLATPEFRSLVDAEKARSERYGALAPQVYRVEEMLGPLTERLFGRLMGEDCKIDEFVKGFLALLKSAGLDQTVQVSGPSGPAVAVQINVPVLENGKLKHLETLTVVQAPALEKEEAE
jgi:hypothetical protein